MSLSAGSLASLCNSRLSRETHPSTLLSSFNLPVDNYLRPESLSLSLFLCFYPFLSPRYIAPRSLAISREEAKGNDEFRQRVKVCSICKITFPIGRSVVVEEEEEEEEAEKEKTAGRGKLAGK